ncbi:hypothetical protein Q5P01_002233 [Channa striata]|uniref:Uncharacterized protein n=1 Tax=Channa striata TaxID=64152 RepID=A0AA88TDS8_CHASR|nr:hypothetical protein Q5P01_002233 [Channa striata]
MGITAEPKRVICRMCSPGTEREQPIKAFAILLRVVKLYVETGGSVFGILNKGRRRRRRTTSTGSLGEDKRKLAKGRLQKRDSVFEAAVGLKDLSKW